MILNPHQNTMFVIFVIFNMVFILSKGVKGISLEKFDGYNLQEIRGYGMDGWMVWYGMLIMLK